MQFSYHTKTTKTKQCSEYTKKQITKQTHTVDRVELKGRELNAVGRLVLIQEEPQLVRRRLRHNNAAAVVFAFIAFAVFEFALL